MSGMPWSCAAGMTCLPTSPVVVAPQIANPPASSQKWRVREASRNTMSAAAPVSRSTRPAAALDRVVGQQAEVTRPLAQQKDNERALFVLREVLLGDDRVDGLRRLGVAEVLSSRLRALVADGVQHATRTHWITYDMAPTRT